MIIIFERPENILSEEKLPVCGCAQSHMYKVGYVLPLRWLVNCLYVCVGVCVCVRACVCVCACVRACVCVCVLIVVSIMRWDTTSRRRGGSLLLNSINLVYIFLFVYRVVISQLLVNFILDHATKHRHFIVSNFRKTFHLFLELRYTRSVTMVERYEHCCNFYLSSPGMY